MRAIRRTGRVRPLSAGIGYTAYSMKSRYTPTQLRILNAVLEEGTYTAAARRLGISQSAVSQAISKLEKNLHMQLFTQRGRHLIPTDFCLQTGAITARMEELNNRLEALLLRGINLETGTLKVALCNAMPGMMLIRRFHQLFPNIRIELLFGNHSTTIGRVWEREADAGILVNAPEDGRFIRHTCASQQLMAIAPLSHSVSQHRTLQLQQLAGLPLIFRSPGSSTQRMVDTAMQAYSIHLEPSFILSTQEGVYEAVTSGLGIGFAWNRSTSRTSQFVRIPVRELTAMRWESAFRRADTSSRIVDAFFETLPVTQSDAQQQ